MLINSNKPTNDKNIMNLETNLKTEKKNANKTNPQRASQFRRIVFRKQKYVLKLLHRVHSHKDQKKSIVYPTRAAEKK